MLLDLPSSGAGLRKLRIYLVPSALNLSAVNLQRGFAAETGCEPKPSV